jgi:hypothetical protein
MALETFYTFSADRLKEEVLKDGKFAKLRLFEYGGMGYNCSLASWQPTWVTTMNSVAESPLFKWYGLREGVTVPYQQRAEGMMSALQHFSATCLYFGVELLEALGPEAPRECHGGHQCPQRAQIVPRSFHALHSAPRGTLVLPFLPGGGGGYRSNRPHPDCSGGLHN